MRNLFTIGVAILSLIGKVARADASTNDEMFANAALRELHNLAAASAQSEQAAKDSDDLGCRDANKSIQEAAHEALKDMHYMSFAPFGAIEDVSTLLRLSHLTPPNGCSDVSETGAHLLPMIAGQAIMALRYDYAIGDGDWYAVNASGDLKAKNPLRYAQSLKDQSYSWVNVRPKDMLLIVESDWKAEMASHQVDDPSIENSGKDLKAVEVDYRRNSGDGNTMVYFHRTKEDALAAAQPIKQQVENDVQWSQKLTSLPYMMANHDVGFKLVYAVCRPGKNTKGENTCDEDSSHDWSDNRSVPYHWFSDIRGCEQAQLSISAKHPGDVKVAGDDALDSACVPASKMSGVILRGYKMVLALSAPGATYDDNAYADLRESGSQTAALFKPFKACYGAMDSIYSKLSKDLGVDEDGNLLSDNTKSIRLTAICTRVY